MTMLPPPMPDAEEVHVPRLPPLRSTEENITQRLAVYRNMGVDPCGDTIPVPKEGPKGKTCIGHGHTIPVSEDRTGMKTCRKCGQSKPLRAFHKDSLMGRCKECRKMQRKAQRKAQREALKRTQTKTKAEMKAEMEARAKARREKHLNYQRRRKYGIGPEQVEAMWEAQEGKCLICDRRMVREGRGSKRCCVDHCHDTGKVRGLLCSKCNKSIGGLQDSRDILKKAIEYLDRTGTGR